MQITAAMVKELRERTGSGMMECKKALTAANGDIEQAIEDMRKSGLAKADKKSDRTAAEGLVIIELSNDNKEAAIVEVNCETDFVSGGDDFKAFATAIAKRILSDSPADVAALVALPLEDGGSSIEETRQAMVARIGENIQVRRFVRVSTDAAFGKYLHGTRIAVLVEMANGNDDLIKDIAMHIAASKPICVSEDQVSAELLEKEKEIFIAQAKESGKPDDIIEKMIVGRMRKYLGEITLLGQPFVKDPDQTVAKLLGSAGATVKSFYRLEVGEGIEKKQENFADEVMAQIKAS
ncbi:MAG: translation elongation factor Ts [Gammaproteobacteria bacterium]|nr:translation elongation factor Ts [Gammaproteobacteria bacterium]